ncbi:MULTISPECIES: acyl-CoA dehydrogenase family protein [Streptomyces]|uniref:acyl-CoA dehydrogenase family protein n=1 Tax=Streptomyces TaxID=1883 RepID=UPI002270BF2A|nr:MULTISPECIES: acyl-CoA dehydrogenase family protein [unclassified Streptomyces]MCY0942624.1 acyl-CoA dehydrogenase family protein [Streptomyces sp. H34-AA3]MCY0951658.1 acyl-CoA dehydrogenase family protein [Streptomyces sp. H27-S2]MCZ4081370.1 acyl-CoA dehydrogenase family protein [Streptomyces sp. H34-S5]
MDFHPTEEQAAAAGLAARIFGDLATHERLAAAGSGSDAELWKALTTAGLIAAVEDVGLLGLVLLLEEQGRTTAQVPYAATCAYGVLPVAAHGSAGQRARLLPALATGEAVATGAFPARGRITAERGRLSGTAPAVPWLREATHVLVPDADRALWLVRTDAPGVRTSPVETTAPWSAGRLTLTGAEAERIGSAGAYEDVLAGARTAFAGLQAGVCAGSLARAVEYTGTREQFGRPLSTNQGVMLRAADAYMDTEAIRVTAYEAAWRIDQGLPAREHALTAAWWASEAGKRVVHAGQHLHGGMGADLEHPVHRHFLWGRQLDAYLGCGSELLAELGAVLAQEG